MENKESYFGEVGSAIKTLAVGLKTTLREYFTAKSTEQYPENRKTTLHVAQRHREKSCPNGSIKILSHMEEDPETGRKKKKLDDYQYDLGDCMFCQLCVNACNFGAIEFVNDFENAVFDRSKLVLHLDKEVYKGGSLPNLIEGGAPITIGKFNTKTK